MGNSSCVVNANENCFTFNSAAMNFTIEQFEQDAALEIFIGKEIQAGTDYKWVLLLTASCLMPDHLIVGYYRYLLVLRWT